MENFVYKYDNIYMAWPNYSMFAIPNKRLKKFIANTRIYSCNLIKNNIPFRWRWRYNEDTILSLDILSKWFCTIQFNSFLQDKLWTQVQKWGNSDEFYLKEWIRKKWQRYADTWTLNKSQMLVDVYPQYAKLKYKFSRIHHIVNYTHFKWNKFIKNNKWNLYDKLTPIKFIKK